MSNEEQVRVNHFAALKSKYQATKYENSSPSSLLYFILRKVELGIEVTQFELDWLRGTELFKTISIIEIKQYKLEEGIRLELELHQLREKYKVPDDLEVSPASFVYPVLWKLDSEHCLDNSEIELLKENNLNQTMAIAQEMGYFKTLKEKYRITDYPDSSPESLLYRILQKLDSRDSLSDLDANWIIDNNFFQIYEIFEQQEKEREAEAEFSLLKSKYGATEYPDTSVSSYLYRIRLAKTCLSNSFLHNFPKTKELCQMTISKSYPHFTPEEYLEIEQSSTIKHEYIQGHIYAMAGASKAHVILTGNLVTLLNNHLRGTGCIVYSTDMKVRIEAAKTFYYPDVAVTCDERDRTSSEDFIRYPRLIIEVLSRKTEAFDRGDKFADYKTIETLEEYVLVNQYQMTVERFQRNAEGFWVPFAYRETDEVSFASVNFHNAIADLYENVALLT